MPDRFTVEERSTLMARIRSTGNKSTEEVVEAALREAKIRGWRKHPKSILGKPDFYFPKARVEVFVDGCFWHACPRCGHLPKSRQEYWHKKIDGNRRRDNRTHRHLREMGFHVLRIWEHEAKRLTWLPRLRRMITNVSA